MLHNNITLNSKALDDGKLEIYLQKREEKDKIWTTATFLHNNEKVATFWNRWS